MHGSRTLAADFSDSDFEPLAARVAAARIVGLGAPTHGASEFFRIHARISEWLVGEFGFSVVAIEAGLPEAERLNRYVLQGDGSPEELLPGLGFWIWNTSEMVEFLEWIRSFNASGQGPIEFCGFDLPYAELAMNNVAEFVLRTDPGGMAELSHRYSFVSQLAGVAPCSASPSLVDASVKAAQEVWKSLDEIRAPFDQRDAEWAMHNAAVVIQAVRNHSRQAMYRDAQMAVNIRWMMAQHPDARMVLWAHNEHVKMGGFSMGARLAREFGPEYAAVGSLFHSGQFNALTFAGRLQPTNAQSAPPESLEDRLHHTGLRVTIGRCDSPPFEAGMLRRLPISAVRGDGFAPWDGAIEEFDASIFIDRITPSDLLPYPLAVLPGPLAPARRGIDYFHQMVCTFRDIPRTWRVLDGRLPDGLAFNEQGVLSGCPLVCGSSSFEVGVEAAGRRESGRVDLTVEDGG